VLLPRPARHHHQLPGPAAAAAAAEVKMQPKKDLELLSDQQQSAAYV
jgi:hypothetical protein